MVVLGDVSQSWLGMSRISWEGVSRELRGLPLGPFPLGNRHLDEHQLATSCDATPRQEESYGSQLETWGSNTLTSVLKSAKVCARGFSASSIRKMVVLAARRTIAESKSEDSGSGRAIQRR